MPLTYSSKGTSARPLLGAGQPFAAARRSYLEVADDHSKRGGQDRERVDVNQDWEVRDWAKKFGVSEEQLRQAVRKVGDRADAVRQHLDR